MPTFKRAQALALGKLASYFKVPKKELRLDAYQTAGVDDSMVRTTLLASRGFDYWLNCVEGDLFVFKEIMNGHRWGLSELYHAFIYGEGMIPQTETTRYLMTFINKGTHWVVRRDFSNKGYRGEGGWYVVEQQTNQGFIIQPLVNFLAERHPPPESID